MVCRLVENVLFPTDEFEEVLDDYIEARLHNDGKIWGTEDWTEATIAIRKLQDELVGDGPLPAYVAMDPETKEVIGLHKLAPSGFEEKLLQWLTDVRAQWKGEEGP